MKWEVIVKNYVGNYRLLSDVLARWDLELLKNVNDWALRSEKFEVCKTHGEVWKIARHVKETLETLSGLNEDVDFKLGLDGLAEYKNDGSKSKHVYVEVKSAVALAIVGHPAVITVSPRPDMSDEERKAWEKKQAEEKYQKLLDETVVRVIPALDNDNVITVMKMLNSDLNPASMGNIVNLIQDDMNGNVSDLVSKTQLTRFERSINHPEVFAERARHIVSKQVPPPVPMHQDEAESFVKNMVKEWLHYKYESRNN